MENIFNKLKIINDLLKIILKYLTKSQNNLLNGKLDDINIIEIIKYDQKIMIKLKTKLCRDKIFEICAKYGKLENMK